MITIDQFKWHLRIDGEHEDDYLRLLLEAAVSYTTEITSVENDSFAPKEYMMAVLLLAATWYENRADSTNGGFAQLPLGYQMLVNFLKPGASHV